MDTGSRIFFNFCDFCFSWTMDHALSNLENFECQGHNSLNFDPIFKIFVPKHISFLRPVTFILLNNYKTFSFYWTTIKHKKSKSKRWKKDFQAACCLMFSLYLYLDCIKGISITSTAKFLWAAQTKKGTACKLV